ncbi:uncharacterized protein LOC112561738 [Pomacea canaliculata]|nr:uncharacterized protein LOC112561738 [Pomacea canaliculata]XP_025090181.1 uncharacterized protein LOC112561738 [Pomacea canaliculata]XP_025090182.1 uncharacterized protein LOC112561738 [Pomacea canaliculata]XP_025090183.1 uncharacterized protein LOC112561738 [Pomacea canaliculata]XP_025090184.1 uncharacterized protein LOC112561738 [Pomacea canaliculata]
MKLCYFLLEKFRNKRHLLKIPTVKKMDVWQLIAKEINKEGWGFSAQACFKKWDNLKNRYKIITERHKATGIGGTRWAYLGVMTDILQEDTSMTAPVINSSLNGIKVYARSKAGESDEENGSAVPTAGWSFQETASPDQPRTSPCVLSGYAETPPRKGKKRKREEPPTWLKEFLEKTSQAIDRLTDVVAERNMLLKQLIEKL